MNEKTPQTCATCAYDTVLVDRTTGTQTTIPAQSGGGTHVAVGYGWYLQSDGWYSNGGAERLWNAADTSSGSIVYWSPYNSTCSCAVAPESVSWLNAVPPSQVPIAEQYVCDATANTADIAFGNQVFCYLLDGSVATDRQKEPG